MWNVPQSLAHTEWAAYGSSLRKNVLTDIKDQKHCLLMGSWHRSLLSVHFPASVAPVASASLPPRLRLHLTCSKGASLHLWWKFPQCFLEIHRGVKAWVKCSPESKKWLFAGRNWRQNQWMEIQIYSKVLHLGHHSFCSSTGKKSHLFAPVNHRLYSWAICVTAKLVFHQPRICRERSILFQVIQSHC